MEEKNRGNIKYYQTSLKSGYYRTNRSARTMDRTDELS